MKTAPLPPLELAAWQPTRDTLQGYAKVLGHIRGHLTPPQPHWQHISLRVGSGGLTTTPMPLPDGGHMEMRLDLRQHRLVANDGAAPWELVLGGRSPRAFGEAVAATLAQRGLALTRDLATGSSDSVYDRQAVEDYWQTLTFVEGVMTAFRAGLPGNPTPIQLWPHHFDLAVTWFSGRKVPGYDPDDVEWADEQMGFGFSTGDGGIPDPYFYVTAYPWPEVIAETPLPAPAYWHREGWNGAVLHYKGLLTVPDPGSLLLAFLRTTQAAGAICMA
jgi:hypothetical protein